VRTAEKVRRIVRKFGDREAREGAEEDGFSLLFGSGICCKQMAGLKIGEF
jgi:hypothetical protein